MAMWEPRTIILLSCDKKLLIVYVMCIYLVRDVLKFVFSLWYMCLQFVDMYINHVEVHLMLMVEHILSSPGLCF